MKNVMIFLCGTLMLAVAGCRQEEKVSLDRALDVNIALNTKTLSFEEPCFLKVSLKNESVHPLTIPDGMVILEFTSFSGSVQHLVPLFGDINNPDPEWDQWKNHTLKAGEAIDLQLDICRLLYENGILISGGLPADDYTLNAFITPEKNMDIVQGALKVRSNYVDVAVSKQSET